MPLTTFVQSRSIADQAIAQAALDLVHDHKRLAGCQPWVFSTRKMTTAPASTGDARKIKALKSKSSTLLNLFSPFASSSITDSLRSEEKPRQGDEGEKKASEYTWYEQVEMVPLLPLGLWKTKVMFWSWYKDLASDSPSSSSQTTATNGEDGGVESFCYAPSGIRIYVKFSVEVVDGDEDSDRGNDRGIVQGDDDLNLPGASGGWRLVESTEMYCPNWFIHWFSQRRFKKAHTIMLDTMMERASQEAVKSSRSS